MQIFDIYYGQQGVPYIKLLDNGEVKKLPLEDFQFNFKLSEQKYCPGYYKSNEYRKCIRSNILSAKQTLCDDCENAVGFKSAFFMKATPTAEMDEYLKKPHHLYLAYFEPGLIKVGTANSERGERRLLEQDAQFYAYVDSADGYKIQVKERETSLKLNITTSVKTSHKLKYLSIKPKLQNALKIFESNFGKLGIHEYPEVKDLTDNYFYPEHFNFVQEDNHLVGKCKGLRGRYLVIENSGYKVFDINYIIGRNIEGYTENYEYLTEKTLFDL